MDLPNTGAFVLPLAAHGFLVGLLVLEQAARPSEQAPCTNIRQAGQIVDSVSDAGKCSQLQLQLSCHVHVDFRITHPLTEVCHQDKPGTLIHVWTCCWPHAGAPSGLSRADNLLFGAGVPADGSCVLLGDKDREVVRLAGQVLAAACAMDLHSALQSAEASMHSQHVIGLVEEVSQPLVLLTYVGLSFVSVVNMHSIDALTYRRDSYQQHKAQRILLASVLEPVLSTACKQCCAEQVPPPCSCNTNTPHHHEAQEEIRKH